MARKRPPNPLYLGFARLLDHHMRSGTRPDPNNSEPWKDAEFAKEMTGRPRAKKKSDDGSAGAAENTVANWRRGIALPDAIEPILRALFGPLRTDGGEDRRALRYEFDKARRAQAGRRLRDATPLSVGEISVAAGDRVGFDRKPHADDIAAAEDPLIQAEHPGVLRAAREFAEMAFRRGNGPDITPAFARLPDMAKEFLAALDCPTTELPHRLTAAEQALERLAGSLELDRIYRGEGPDEGEKPLPADMRVALGILLNQARRFLNAFPLLRRRNTPLAAPPPGEYLDASREVAEHLDERGDLTPDAWERLQEILRGAEARGSQGDKGREQLVATIVNNLLFGGAAIMAPTEDERPALRERLLTLFREKRDLVERLAAGMSKTVAESLRQAAEFAAAAGDGTESGRDAPWPPRTPFRQWREPLRGLPEAAWPDMVTLPACRFTMGRPEDEEGDAYERPQREVTVERPFALGRVAVTFAQWDAAVAAGFVPPEGAEKPEDRGWGRGDRPVINLSWHDAQAYCAWLNERLGLRAGTYRLPSEAEWEYACRSGTATPFSFGATISPSQVNYDVNYTYGRGKKGEYRERTAPVGSLPANDWGLHEMHGNVWEWCEDAFGEYPNHATDSRPLTLPDSSLRVLRGGSWSNDPSYCRSACRVRGEPEDRSISVGFRLARTLF